MISQHYLQQQRLNSNHDRLLSRYSRLLNPTVSHFRPFGTSSLPGRNYEQYLSNMGGKSHDNVTPLALLSRARATSSNESNHWLNNVSPENLPHNINSTVRHRREQPVPLVHAEKFEPIKVYEHPLFGPTPSYLRPIVETASNSDNNHQNNDDDDDDDEGTEVDSGTKHTETDKRQDEPNPENQSTTVPNDDETSENAPPGYISYKKWKNKYENVIPVNPLLFTIYTQRSNGSLHSYGQSVYASLDHKGRPNHANRNNLISSPTPSDPGSDTSEIAPGSSVSNRRYTRLKRQTFSKPRSTTFPSTGPAVDDDDDDDSEDSPPDSPVPYLSRNLPNPIAPTSLAPRSPTISTPPAPVTNLDKPLFSSSMAPAFNSTIPPAPPMPSSLLPTTTTTNYPPSSNSTGIYQTPSSLSATGSTAVPPAGGGAMSTAAKAVSFGASTTATVPNDDISSSSDSDDDKETRKRKRQKKRLAAGITEPESSSSDD